MLFGILGEIVALAPGKDSESGVIVVQGAGQAIAFTVGPGLAERFTVGQEVHIQVHKAPSRGSRGPGRAP